MTGEEREAFLADVHVGVLAIDEPGRGPLALPVWYQYDDGAVWCRIDDGSVKAQVVAGGRSRHVHRAVRGRAVQVRERRRDR